VETIRSHDTATTFYTNGRRAHFFIQWASVRWPFLGNRL